MLIWSRSGNFQLKIVVLRHRGSRIHPWNVVQPKPGFRQYLHPQRLALPHEMGTERVSEVGGEGNP